MLKPPYWVCPEICSGPCILVIHSPKLPDLFLNLFLVGICNFSVAMSPTVQEFISIYEKNHLLFVSFLLLHCSIGFLYWQKNWIIVPHSSAPHHSSDILPQMLSHILLLQVILPYYSEQFYLVCKIGHFMIHHFCWITHRHVEQEICCPATPPPLPRRLHNSLPSLKKDGETSCQNHCKMYVLYINRITFVNVATSSTKALWYVLKVKLPFTISVQSRVFIFVWILRILRNLRVLIMIVSTNLTSSQRCSQSFLKTGGTFATILLLFWGKK